jgi:hypothetical protein
MDLNMSAVWPRGKEGRPTAWRVAASHLVDCLAGWSLATAPLCAMTEVSTISETVEMR